MKTLTFIKIKGRKNTAQMSPSHFIFYPPKSPSSNQGNKLSSARCLNQIITRILFQFSHYQLHLSDRTS